MVCLYIYIYWINRTYLKYISPPGFFLVPIRTLFLKVQPMISETYSSWIASCWSKLSRALWFMCEIAQIWNDKAATYSLSHNRLFGWNSKLHLNISKKKMTAVCAKSRHQTHIFCGFVSTLRVFGVHFQEAKLFMPNFNSYFGHYCWCLKLGHNLWIVIYEYFKMKIFR